MVDRQLEDVDDISDYVKSRAIFIAKKEKKEWQNILGKVAMNPQMKTWIREILATRYKGV